MPQMSRNPCATFFAVMRWRLALKPHCGRKRPTNAMPQLAHVCCSSVITVCIVGCCCRSSSCRHHSLILFCSFKFYPCCCPLWHSLCCSKRSRSGRNYIKQIAKILKKHLSYHILKIFLRYLFRSAGNIPQRVVPVAPSLETMVSRLGSSLSALPPQIMVVSVMVPSAPMASMAYSSCEGCPFRVGCTLKPAFEVTTWSVLHVPLPVAIYP